MKPGVSWRGAHAGIDAAAMGGLTCLAKEVVVSGESAPQFNIHEAKTHLSRIIERVERGEEIIISRAGHPVAKLIPLTRAVHRTGRGSLRGKLVLTDGWDAQDVNEDIARDFGLVR